MYLRVFCPAPSSPQCPAVYKCVRNAQSGSLCHWNPLPSLSPQDSAPAEWCMVLSSGPGGRDPSAHPCRGWSSCTLWLHFSKCLGILFSPKLHLWWITLIHTLHTQSWVKFFAHFYANSIMGKGLRIEEGSDCLNLLISHASLLY